MTLAPPSLPEFDAFVDRAVLGASAAATDFSALLEALPGIGPTDAVRALETGGRDPHVRRLLADARKPGMPTLPFDQVTALPLPHPLDMEWRFTDATAESLLANAIAVTRDGDAILLLGVPSIAAAAAKTTVDRTFLVTGEGNVICEALQQATRADPRFVHRSSGRKAAAAIVDPPWYIGAYTEMLAECSDRCAPGASVWLAMPPIGVRPSARQDRSVMLKIATTSGFATTNESERAVYRTPLFELTAWQAAGIGAWLPAWRSGDIVRLIKRRDPAGLAPKVIRPPAFELTLDGVRIKLLLDQTGPAELKPLVAGEVLPSVSARLPGRERASLWTSSNRAFCVDSRLALAAIFALAEQRGLVWQSGFTSEEIVQRDPATVDGIHALTHQIETLATREIALTEAYLGETAWLRKLNDARFSGEPWTDSPKIQRGAVA